MTEWVQIGDEIVGHGRPTYVIGEIGINHNGDLDVAKQLIDVSAVAGAQAVKFQKRTPAIATPNDMKATRRQTPWGEMSYLDYRYRVEFEREQYTEIAAHAMAQGVDWFASPWDVPSAGPSSSPTPTATSARRPPSCSVATVATERSGSSQTACSPDTRRGRPTTTSPQQKGNDHD